MDSMNVHHLRRLKFQLWLNLFLAFRNAGHLGVLHFKWDADCGIGEDLMPYRYWSDLKFHRQLSELLVSIR
jgi:hypothetical protein